VQVAFIHIASELTNLAKAMDEEELIGKSYTIKYEDLQNTN